MKVANAAEKFENFMRQGHYPQLNYLKKEKKEIHQAIRQKMINREDKRIVFEEQRMVAKFVSKGIYQTDYEGFNEYLHNKGMLPFVCDIDGRRINENLYWKEELEDFQNETAYYVVPSFNKKGKELNQYEPVIPDKDEETLILLFETNRKQLDVAIDKYEGFKKGLILCEELKSKRKLPHSYGSISLREYPPSYDQFAIYNEVGPDALIQFGKPNLKRLDKFIEKGLISKKEVDAFKTQIDQRLDFVVMSLDSEQRMLDNFHSKQLRIIEEQKKRA